MVCSRLMSEHTRREIRVLLDRASELIREAQLVQAKLQRALTESLRTPAERRKPLRKSSR